MNEIIRSKDNAKVKRLTAIHDRRKASREGLVFLEGLRLCEEALQSGCEVITVCVDENNISWLDKWEKSLSSTDKIIVSKECFAKICSTVNPQGVALIIKEPTINNNDIPFKNSGNDIYVVLESLQDPGNMGTIIRLADAFDFTAVIMTQGCVDPFNEKVIRSSMGSIWHIPLIKSSTEDVFKFCQDKNITTMAMELHGELLSDSEISLPAAYFIGNEGNGLNADTINNCNLKVKIPMPGKAESLNAASAASIMGYALNCARKYN